MYKTSFVYLLNYCLFSLLLCACNEDKQARPKQPLTEHQFNSSDKNINTNSTNLEIIPLKYRSAKNLLAVISPHLAAEGKISYEDKRLIISSTDENLLVLKVLIAELDIPKKQLRLSINMNFELNNSSISINSQHFSTTNNTERRSQTLFKSTENRNEIQHLIITEEQTAAISIEKNRAIASIGWPPTTFNQQTLQAFKITPVLSQENVELQLTIQNTHEGKKTSIDTLVSGTLHQWIIINGPSDNSQFSSEKNTTVQTRRRLEQSLIAIKVEILQ